MADQANQNPVEPIDAWGIVDLMGHTRYAGRISEETHMGVLMGRIDIPQKDGAFRTIFFGGGAVFNIIQTTEDIARAVALVNNRRPIYVWDLPALGAGQTHERDDEDEDDTDA